MLVVKVKSIREPGHVKTKDEEIDSSLLGKVLTTSREYLSNRGTIAPTNPRYFYGLMNAEDEALLSLMNAVLNGSRVFTRIDSCRFMSLGENSSEHPCLRVKATDESGESQIIELRCGEQRLLKGEKESQLENILDRAIEARSETGFRLGGADRPARLLISILNDAEVSPVPLGRNNLVVFQLSTNGMSDVLERTDIVHLAWLVATNCDQNPEVSDWVRFLLPQSDADWDSLREKSPMFRHLISKLEKGFAELHLKFR